MDRPVRKGLRIGEEKLTFRFDGRRVGAQRGDTIASALLAAGERLFSRSLKYHRPRGVFSAGQEEPSALVTCGAKPNNVPNLPATVVTVRDGLEVFSQNCWPSLRYDFGSMLGLGGKIFGAGFYYKTFIWPSWRVYEGIIRRLAGLGAAPIASNLQSPTTQFLECDVLVAGGGAAGLAAALAASRGDARVVLCDREPALGGELDFEDARIDRQSAQEWIAEVQRELLSNEVQILTRTSVVGEAGNLVIAHQTPCGLASTATVFRISAGSTVLATGATEQPIVFANNDRPGVMLLNAAEKFLTRYGVRVGNSIVLFGNNNRVYSAARRFSETGMQVAAIVDTREEVAPDFTANASTTGIRCYTGHAIMNVFGRSAVSGVRIAEVKHPERSTTFQCDAVLVSGGWRPRTHAESVSRDNLFSAGAASGIYTIERAIRSGLKAGALAACNWLPDNGYTRPVSATGDPDPEQQKIWRSMSPQGVENRQFVDLQNDVTVADLRQSVEHGFVDIEHAKRFTMLATGTDQGETGGLPGAAILAELCDHSGNPARLSRRRPPYQPVSLVALAGYRHGERLRPYRHTSLHDWHSQNGAVMEDTMRWQRPRYFRSNGKTLADAAANEAAAVRRFGGILDASTLGKIEVVGRNASKFLDFLCLTKASYIKAGRSKYMVLLREDGMVLDDGIVMRLADDRFLATVSSGHADQIFSRFRFYRDKIAGFRRVVIADVTEAWSVIAVSGPVSRDTLKCILGEEWIDTLSAMTHMEFRDGTWNGHYLRVLRASFSGELAFELHCKSSIAEALWRSLVEAGMTPYGLEALDTLRIEKGYLTSAEINGQTSPHDLGLSLMVSAGNECIGRELLDRPALHSVQRETLVGLQAQSKGAPFLAGAQLTAQAELNSSVGHVTSSAYSPTLDEWVGLALVRRDLTMIDTRLVARDPLRGTDTPVRVSPAVHLDPDGTRMKT